ncbi:hypothetical protein [Methylocystis sp.]|uniref:hypothetical protein n=1 Tax=Methylocystis sp. TaxID=1911079 RepID=UPI0025F8F524|nr:hypothetical protein [Methylocystis sp.]
MTIETHNAQPIAPQAKRPNHVPAWLSLRAALRLVLDFVRKDQRCIERAKVLQDPSKTYLLTVKEMVLRDRGDDIGDIDLFDRAIKKIARESLERLLKQGRIRGDGFREDIHQRAEITEIEWATRRIEFGISALLPPRGYRDHPADRGDLLRASLHPRDDNQWEKSFPPITGVMVNADDICAALEHPAKADAVPADKLAGKTQPSNKELREFLIELGPYSEQRAREEVEKRFETSVPRDRIREIRKKAGIKGRKGRPPRPPKISPTPADGGVSPENL